MLTVVTIGTTQPARSSMRRVNSCRRRAISGASWSSFGLSSGRVSSAMGFFHQIDVQFAMRASPAAPDLWTVSSVNPARSARPESPS